MPPDIRFNAIRKKGRRSRIQDPDQLSVKASIIKLVSCLTGLTVSTPWIYWASMSKGSDTSKSETRALERAGIVLQLRKVLAWLDANEEPMAAIHVNQAIEDLEPTTIFSYSSREPLN